MPNSSDKKLISITPLSRQDVIIVCLVLGLVVMAWTLDSVLNPAIKSTDLNIVATMVSKDIESTLYPRDNLFANDKLYRLYTPLYRWLIYQMWQLGGTFEAGLIWLVPIVLTAYLAGMFILLWQVTGDSWISLALTIASAHYHNTMGAGVWGVGGSHEMMSRALFMPAVPLMALILLKILEKPNWRKGAALGLILGVFTNMHPISGLHLLLILSGLLVLGYGNSYRGWQTVISIGLVFIIGAFPFIKNFVQNSAQPVSREFQFEVFSQIVSERYSLFFFPATFEWPLLNLSLTRPVLDILAWVYLALFLLGFGFYIWGRHRWPGLVRWSWLAGGLISVIYAYIMVLFDSTFIFAMVGLYIVYSFWRGKYPTLIAWLIALTGLVVLYAFVGYYLLTLIWQSFEIWGLTSLLIEYARSARFVYLPIYLLAGLAGATVVEKLTSYFEIRGKSVNKTVISLEIAVIFGLAPNLSNHFSNSVLLTLLAITLLILLTLLIIFVLSKIQPPWRVYTAVIILVLILFGPVAPLTVDYLPIPAKNLFNVSNLVVGSVSNPVDAELYDWVLQNTDNSALFYGCFGSETMTYFRHKAQRSITHNWKDLAYNVYNRATLLSAYNHYRTLEAGCKSFESAISVAHTLKSDYILVSSQDAVEFLHTACFINEKYTVFELNPSGCVLD